MAFQPMVFRPANKEQVDHIESRSKEYGSRNKYLLSLIDADRGITIEISKTADLDLDAIALKVAQILKDQGISIWTEQEKPKQRLTSGHLKKLIGSIKDV